MTDILQAIDDYTSDRYSDLRLKLFGFCEIMHKTSKDGDQPMPVTIPGRQQVSLDDRYDLITWIRWNEPIRYSPNPDWSFGSRNARQGTMSVRIVIAHRITLGEELVFDFVNNFPQSLNITGFNYVFVDDTQRVDPDHENIYLTELGKTVYEKHRFEWNLYVVNFDFQFMPCDTDTFRILESGELRITES